MSGASNKAFHEWLDEVGTFDKATWDRLKAFDAFQAGWRARNHVRLTAPEPAFYGPWVPPIRNPRIKNRER